MEMETPKSQETREIQEMKKGKRMSELLSRRWSDSGRDRSLEWDDRGYRASSGVSLAPVDNGDDDDRDNAQDD